MSMNYHSINHKMWSSRNGTYRNILRAYGDSTAIVASYLMSSPHANQSGLYYCPVIYIATETERSPDDVERCLGNLGKEGFCKYDFEEDVVWVISMVRYQVINWPENRTDNRYKGVIRALRSVPSSYLIDDFCDLWGIPLDEIGHDSQAPSKPLVSPLSRSPLQAPPKGALCTVCSVEEGGAETNAHEEQESRRRNSK